MVMGALFTMKKFLAVLLFVAILLPASNHLLAQSVSAMTGTVTDSSGAVMPGVTVTLVNKVRGLAFTQITNSSGTYRFSDIPRATDTRQRLPSPAPAAASLR